MPSQLVNRRNSGSGERAGPPAPFARSSNSSRENRDGCYICRFRKKKCIKNNATDASCTDCQKFNFVCEGAGEERPHGKDLAKIVQRHTKLWISDKALRQNSPPMRVSDIWLNPDRATFAHAAFMGSGLNLNVLNNGIGAATGIHASRVNHASVIPTPSAFSSTAATAAASRTNQSYAHAQATVPMTAVVPPTPHHPVEALPMFESEYGWSASTSHVWDGSACLIAPHHHYFHANHRSEGSRHSTPSGSTPSSSSFELPYYPRPAGPPPTTSAMSSQLSFTSTTSLASTSSYAQPAVAAATPPAIIESYLFGDSIPYDTYTPFGYSPATAAEGSMPASPIGDASLNFNASFLGSGVYHPGS